MWLLVGASLLAELFEVAWQQAETFDETIARAAQMYRRSVFVFLAMHPGYWVSLFVALYIDRLTWPILLILTLKIIDIVFKFDLIEHKLNDIPTAPSVHEMLTTPVPRWYFLSGVVTYPWLVYVACNTALSS